MAERLAAITGASSGIGYNLAKVFAENGFDLVIGSAGERLEQAAEDFKALGAQVTVAQADLATREGCDEFWRAVEGTGRNLDAIAINAGA
jgi:short-subunit dehydrogenase